MMSKNMSKSKLKKRSSQINNRKHWRYKDVADDLRIYFHRNKRFKNYHISVFNNGDYHASVTKPSQNLHYGYVRGRFVNKAGQLAKVLFFLFEQCMFDLSLPKFVIKRMKCISEKQKHRRDKMKGIEWAKIKEKGLWRQGNFGCAQKKVKSSKMKNTQPWSPKTFSKQSKPVKLQHSKSIMKQKENYTNSSKARGSEGFVSHPLQGHNS